MELPRTPSSRLDGRRALVTGAGRGIGLACAAALAQAGAHVVLAARTTSEIDEVAGSIRLDDGTAESITLDITDINATTDAIAGLEAFDILVNNAGMNRPVTFLEVTVEDFDYVVGLNLRAAFFVAQTVCPSDGRVGQTRFDHQYLVGHGLGRRSKSYRVLFDQARDGRHDQSYGD
jgi:NAD(P)-dependent dehydrogenase (short-subunit alcohol dehydrogenase family)